MTNCPVCRTPMKKERKELQKGIFALVETCPKCKDEWIDEKGYEALYNMFTRQAFKIGGSVAIRIPKELANVIGLKDGTNVRMLVKERKLIVEPTS